MAQAFQPVLAQVKACGNPLIRSNEAAMLIPCSRTQAVFPGHGIRLDRRTPGFMVWDEHGGTYVLRVEELEATAAAGEPEGGIRLEIPLSRQESLIPALEEFAAVQQLPLAPTATSEFSDTALLAACHLPGQNLFIFAEEPGLTATRRGEAVELAVEGHFEARRVPCQETDLVIHLNRAAMARLVAFVLSQARSGL